MPKEYGKVFKSGDVFTSESIDVTESKGGQADGVVVTFTVDSGNVTLTANTIPAGTTFAAVNATTYTWTLGTVLNQTVSGTFDVTVNDNDTEHIYIPYVVTSITTEADLSDNNGDITITGISYNNFKANDFEGIYEIPDTAFVDNDKPLISEVQTWVDSNIPVTELLSGTILTYNPDPYTFTTIYNDFGVAINAGTGVTGTFKGISVNGTDYLQDFAYDTDDAGVFDEAAFQTFIENSLSSAGITATVLVTEISFLGTTYTVSISSQNGITEFKLYNNTVDQAGELLPSSDESSLAEAGTKEPKYIWRLNKDTSDSSQISIVRNRADGNIWYISPDSFDPAYVVKGSPEFSAGSLERLMQFSRVSDGDVIVYSAGDHTSDAIYGVATYTGQDINTVLDIVYSFTQGSSLHFQSTDDVRSFLKSENDSSQYQPTKLKILGRPDLQYTGLNTLIDSGHPKNEHIIELGRLTNTTPLKLYEGAGKYVSIDIDEVKGYQDLFIYFTVVSGAISGFEKSDGDTDALQDDSFVKIRLGNVSTSSYADLITFGVFGQSQDIKNLNFLLDIDSFVGNSISGGYHILDISGFTGASSGSEFGFEDSTFKIKIKSLVDDYAGSSRAVYTNNSFKRLITFRDRLVNSTVIVEGLDIRSGNPFFGINAFSGDANSTVTLDNSKIIFRNCNIECEYNLFNFVFQDNNNLDNNSEIVFENCNLISNNSYIADFDLRPGNADDGTTVVRFKNCRLETKAASQSLIHFRGTNLVLQDCILVNDGTAEDITSDAGAGTINLSAINTYSNSLTSTDTSFSLVVGGGITRDTNVI